MEPVSANTEQDLNRQQAMAEMAYASRQLAANLIRVVRGAGRPFQLGDQCADFLNAAQAYRVAHGIWPTEEMHDWLSVRSDVDERLRIEKADAAKMRAVDDIVAGSLQMAASRLLAQRTQEAAGRSEMVRGINAREEALDLMRGTMRLDAKSPRPFSRRALSGKKLGG